MLKKSKFVLGIITFIILSSIGLLSYDLLRDNRSNINIKKIELGMTKDQVKFIMGEPTSIKWEIFNETPYEMWRFYSSFAASTVPACFFGKTDGKVKYVDSEGYTLGPIPWKIKVEEK